MSNVYFNRFDQNRAPGREQNLFVSHSKHLYLTQDGQLKYQKKELDPRLPGKRVLLQRFVLLDVDSGTVYGEMHELEGPKHLAGFLARAWHLKPDNVMRGIPALLNVPQAIWDDADYQADIRRLKEWGGFDVGSLPGGFSAGIHAVKQFEKTVESLFWRTSESCPPDISMIRSLAAVLSSEASNSMSHLWKERWLNVSPAPTEFFNRIDGLYQTHGAWRLGDYKIVLEGIPKNAL